MRSRSSSSLIESPPSPEPKVTQRQTKPSSKRDTLPRPPAFRAVPRYASAHQFLGRKEELAKLSTWASSSNPKPLFLLEAIGGSGKSLLTWQWINHRAPEVRSDWAGRFWYSFYEKDAVMAQFCREALAYMTGEPMETLRKTEILDLGDKLIEELTARPWLVVMDGLERCWWRITVTTRISFVTTKSRGGRSDRQARSLRYTEDDELLRRLQMQRLRNWW